MVETEARNTMFDCSLGVRGLVYYTESRVAYGAGAFFFGSYVCVILINISRQVS